MSHSKIRTEKICLNCGSAVPQRFCPACGQENIEPRQSVGHLITHFFSDITHFDGKFFVTVKDLFQKPGFLSGEYMQGRRQRYLDPIRMYIFTSAIFFIFFFSVVKMSSFGTNWVTEKAKTAGQSLDQVLRRAGNAQDSATIRKAFAEGPGRVQAFLDSIDGNSDRINLAYEVGQFNSVAQYDSTQRALPEKRRDSWAKRMLIRKNIVLNEKFSHDKSTFFKEWFAVFLHNSPKFLFISLPVFALLLKLLYLRRRRFYYVDHGIFAVHLYIFTFLILLLYFGLSKLKSATGWEWMWWLIAALFIFSIRYFYKAMRHFYGQSGLKTLLKFVLLFFLSFVVQFALFLIYFFFSLLSV